MGEYIEKIDRALADLRQGKFVLIYDNDNREGETDFVMASQFVTPNIIKKMRKDGGGLIFLMISHEIGHHLQLPFLADLYMDIRKKYPVVKELAPNDIPYDTKSSFSLYINHRKTFTGITDIDRSLTMGKFAELVHRTQHLDGISAMKAFGKEFRSPGHVPICIASKKLLHERKGHTEISIALLEMAGLIPVGSGCEMMGNNGKALSSRDAQKYAVKNRYIFLDGKEILKAWKTWSK